VLLAVFPVVSKANRTMTPMVNRNFPKRNMFWKVSSFGPLSDNKFYRPGNFLQTLLISTSLFLFSTSCICICFVLSMASIRLVTSLSYAILCSGEKASIAIDSLVRGDSIIVVLAMERRE
jgi:hypothetical protein